MKMQGVVAWLVCCLATGCSSVSPVTALVEDLDDTQSLDRALSRIVGAGVAPGLVVTVVKDGGVVYAKGFGQADGNKAAAVTPDSLFNLWSVSKLFTQLTVLSLVDSGDLNLDESVCRYTAWLADSRCNSENQYSTRTLRSLLNHSAGIPDLGLELYAQTQFSGDSIPDQRELANQLLPPMRKWSPAADDSSYSNSHYLLLGAIVEEVTSRPMADVIRERVLDPLGLTSTGYRPNPKQGFMHGSHPVDLTSFMAFRLIEKSRAVALREHGRYWFNPVYNAALGSTGLLSNASDMSSFMNAMLGCLGGRTGLLVDSLCEQILLAQELPVVKSPARGVAGLRQKLGWFVRDESRGRSFSHGGSGMAYTSMLQLFPDANLGVFVVANDTYFDRAGGLALASAISAMQW